MRVEEGVCVCVCVLCVCVCVVGGEQTYLSSLCKSDLLDRCEIFCAIKYTYTHQGQRKWKSQYPIFEANNYGCGFCGCAYFVISVQRGLICSCNFIADWTIVLGIAGLALDCQIGPDFIFPK